METERQTAIVRQTGTEMDSEKQRLRLIENKAGYMAIPVADRWAGAEMQLSATKYVLKRSFTHLSTRVHGPTDRRTNGWTKPLLKLRVRNCKEKSKKKVKIEM